MAVELTATTAAFTGTGAVAVYASAIYVIEPVTLQVRVNGVLKVLGDDYTLSNLGSSAGVSVTANFPLGANVVLLRVTPRKQEVDTQNNETILEDVLDAALDKVTMITQEVGERSDRALVVPVGEAPVTIPAIVARAGRIAKFGDVEDGAPLAAADLFPESLELIAANMQSIIAVAASLGAFPNIILSPATLPNSTGDVYNQALGAIGGIPPYTYALVSGTLPPGITLSAAGVLSGTSLVSGTSSFTIAATDSSIHGPFTGTRAYTITSVAATPFQVLLGALPADTMFANFAPRFATVPRLFLKNELAASSGPGLNLLSAPRRKFSLTNYFSSNGLTVSDASLAAPDGSNEASRLQFDTSSLSYLQRNIAALPAGNYVLGVVARTHDQSSTVTMKQGFFTTEAVKNITGTYTVIATAIAHPGGAANLMLLRSDAAVKDLDVIDAFLISGSAVPATPADVKALGVEDGHMIFGPDAATAQPTVTGSGVNTNATTLFGLVRLATAVNLTGFSLFIAARRNSAGLNLATAVSKDGNGPSAYQDFSVAYGQGASFAPSMFMQAAGTTSNISSAWQPRTTDVDIIGFRYDGAEFSAWLDDVKLDRATLLGKSTSVHDLIVNNLNNFGAYADYKLYGMVMTRSAMLDAPFRALAAAFRNYLADAAGVVVAKNKMVCFEGDSISSDVGTSGATGSYNRLFVPNSAPVVNGFRIAAASAVLGVTNAGANQNVANSLYARRTIADSMLPPDKRGRKFTYTALIGANDGPGWGTPALYAQRLGEFLLARKLAGFDYVVAITILPRNDASFNTWRNAVNAIMRTAGWKSTYTIDGFADFGGNATYGTDAAAADNTKYPDGVHPNDAAHAAFEPLFRTAMNALPA